MSDNDITTAITDAASGNMETWREYDNEGISLDAESFLIDLRSAGWDIVRRTDAPS